MGEKEEKNHRHLSMIDLSTPMNPMYYLVHILVSNKNIALFCRSRSSFLTKNE